MRMILFVEIDASTHPAAADSMAKCAQPVSRPKLGHRATGVLVVARIFGKIIIWFGGGGYWVGVLGAR